MPDWEGCISDRLSHRFLERAKRLFEPKIQRGPSLRRAILAVAAIGFLGGIVLSVRAQPNLLHDIQWTPVIAIAVVAVPLTLLLNAIEFIFAARLVGQPSSLGRALEITVIGSAANLLPLPGAALVRFAALKSGGASLRSNISITALLAILSLGLGLAYSGAWAAMLNGNWVAIAMVSGGAMIVLLAWIATCEFLGRAPDVLGLVAVRVGLIVLDAARTWLAFKAIAYPAGFDQASVLTVSTVLAAVVAIVPSGLGLREGIAAFMAPLIGLNAAAAFLATSVSRIVGLTIVMILTAAMITRSKTSVRNEKSR